MKKVRYGIIGFGNFAERAIAPAIRASANSELVAIQKRSLQAAKEKAAHNAIPLAFDSAEALVAHPDVDAVFIVSANSMHASQTVIAARAGKHVLVEKPMACTVREAKQMMEACSRNKVKLMVGHMVRLSPVVRRMKEMVKGGAIGRVSFVKTEFIYDGRQSRRGWLLDQRIAGGGPLFDVGVHCLDTIRFILEDRVDSVECSFDPVPTRTRTESTANVSLTFSRGTLASIYCSYDSPVRRSFIEIVGTDGVLSAYNFTRSNLQVSLAVSRGGMEGEAITHTENITVPDLYAEEVTLFSASILDDSVPPIPGSEGLENQKVLERAVKAGT